MRKDVARHQIHSIRKDLARLVLTVFVLTFLSARILVLLIMTHRIPDLFLHLGGTHVHHLNYGILLLAGSGGYLLFSKPVGQSAKAAAIAYSVGLALTFDEFGMWLHLGGGYWQRASFDAVVIVAAVLCLPAFSPPLHLLRRRHFAAGLLVLAASAIFGKLMINSIQTVEQKLEPKLHRIEESGPK